MTAETVTAPVAERWVPPAGVAARLIRYLKAQVEDWYDECRHLTLWEDEHLLDDPRPKELAEHGKLLDELERVGRWLYQTTHSADFPDLCTAQLVSTTLQDLKDRRAMWHGQDVSEERRAEILKACFNES